MIPHLWLLKLLWRTIPVSSKSAFKLRLELKGDLSYETTKKIKKQFIIF